MTDGYSKYIKPYKLQSDWIVLLVIITSVLEVTNLFDFHWKNFDMIAFIQARMSSRRLPRKSLMSIAGRPMLYWVINNVRKSLLANDVIVLTSTEMDDNKIEAFCSQEGVKCIRGDLTNVHSRFLSALSETGVQAFVRISGDSPLIDPDLIDQAIAMYQENAVDIVTNTSPRSFPKGQSIEVINSQALFKLSDYNLTFEEKEHVTLGIYNRATEFEIKNFKNAVDYSTVQLSIDSHHDLELMKKIFKRRKNEQLSWKKALTLSYHQK